MSNVLITSEDRGKTDIGWLNSKHTFSFGQYHNPKNLNFGVLRVINEDIVEPNKGFGTHGHRDMEIISIVLDGELAHKDSIGNGSVIMPGDIQRMSAGTGIQHSEFNPSIDQQVHFLQVWITPSEQGINPGYEQKTFDNDRIQGQWTLVGSQDGRDGSVTIHQDLNLYKTLLLQQQSVSISLSQNRMAWLHVVKGNIQINDRTFKAGDGIGFASQTDALLQANNDAELLLFEMAQSDDIQVSDTL